MSFHDSHPVKKKKKGASSSLGRISHDLKATSQQEAESSRFLTSVIKANPF